MTTMRTAEGERRDPKYCRVCYGLGTPFWVVRASALKHRRFRLKAIGNAVVPQVAEWIGRRIIEADARMKLGGGIC